MLLGLENSQCSSSDLDPAWCSGDVDVFRLGNIDIGEPVAADNQFTVIAHTIGAEVGTVLALFAEGLPALRVVNDADIKRRVFLLHRNQGARRKAVVCQRLAGQYNQGDRVSGESDVKVHGVTSLLLSVASALSR